MPFLRFSRDRRGYEHVYLMHASTRRGKPSRPRILYWYRTPPGVKVGRPPFDDEVQRTLEAANPGVVFDWPAIIATPMPPPDPAETWRERRRLEKLARQARRQEEPEDVAVTGLDAAGPTESAVPASDITESPQTTMESRPAAADSQADGGAPPGVRPPGARRRRRGGRRRRGQGSVGRGDSIVPGSAADPSSGLAGAAEPRDDVPAVQANPPDRPEPDMEDGPDSHDA